MVLTKCGSEWEIRKIEDDDKHTTVSFTEDRFPVYVSFYHFQTLKRFYYQLVDFINMKRDFREKMSRFVTVTVLVLYV